MTRARKRAVWVGFAVLAVLHQDFWLWDDPRLVWGFVPVGLAYHVGFSIAAATFWALACRYAWPREWEDMAKDPPQR